MIQRSALSLFLSFYLFCLTLIHAYHLQRPRTSSSRFLIPSYLSKDKSHVFRVALGMNRADEGTPIINMKVFDNFNDPKPGAPRIIQVNQEKGYADIRLYLNEVATMQAHKDLTGIFVRVSPFPFERFHQ